MLTTTVEPCFWTPLTQVPSNYVLILLHMLMTTSPWKAYTPIIRMPFSLQRVSISLLGSTVCWFQNQFKIASTQPISNWHTFYLNVSSPFTPHQPHPITPNITPHHTSHHTPSPSHYTPSPSPHHPSHHTPLPSPVACAVSLSPSPSSSSEVASCSEIPLLAASGRSVAGEQRPRERRKKS